MTKTAFVRRWQPGADRCETPRQGRTQSILFPRVLGASRVPVMISFNLVGAAGAVYFARSGYLNFQRSHSLIGSVFLAEQLWIVVAYLLRRRAHVVTQRIGDWLLAFAGTFGGVLFRPQGAHPHWGVAVGFVLQIVGLSLCVVSFFSLGRSFGFAAADRGIKTRGSYRVVRHPIYASYIFLTAGYVVQSISIRNLLVMFFVLSCDAGRVTAEERLLRTNSAYLSYCDKVRWRVVPGVW